jgi:hypothetical protein
MLAGHIQFRTACLREAENTTNSGTAKGTTQVRESGSWLYVVVCDLDIANEMDARDEAKMKTFFEAHPELTLENLAKPSAPTE